MYIYIYIYIHIYIYIYILYNINLKSYSIAKIDITLYKMLSSQPPLRLKSVYHMILHLISIKPAPGSRNQCFAGCLAILLTVFLLHWLNGSMINSWLTGSLANWFSG